MAESRLLVEPKNELVFTGPFDKIVSSTIKLTNTTAQRVCFKVKTTVPRSYCVKPSSGFVNSGASLDVEVLLQPFDQIPADKNKHKFMVQSLVAPTDPNADIEQMWRDAQPGDLQDSKLKCVMRMPEEIVSISPSNALIFEGPFTQPSSALLKITNNSENNICFKIQITNPKMFSVTPVSGFVESFATQNVKIVMHPWDFDPKSKYKDRFLIQWASAPQLTSYSDSIWTENIVRNDRILKCIYQLPENSATSVNKTSTSDTFDVTNDPAKLVAELTRLRSENSSLRDNDVRLRRLVKNEDSSRSHSQQSVSNSLSMNQLVILIIVAIIAGVIIGYFIS